MLVIPLPDPGMGSTSLLVDVGDESALVADLERVPRPHPDVAAGRKLQAPATPGHTPAPVAYLPGEGSTPEVSLSRGAAASQLRRQGPNSFGVTTAGRAELTATLIAT